MNPLALLGLLRANWQLIAGVAVVALIFGGGWVVNGWRLKANESESLRSQIEQSNLSSTGLEIQLELQRRAARDITRRYANEIRKDDYRCRLPADGVRLLNESRTRASSEPHR